MFCVDKYKSSFFKRKYSLQQENQESQTGLKPIQTTADHAIFYRFRFGLSGLSEFLAQ
jgi:hypothetical protein